MIHGGDNCYENNIWNYSFFITTFRVTTSSGNFLLLRNRNCKKNTKACKSRMYKSARASNFGKWVVPSNRFPEIWGPCRFVHSRFTCFCVLVAIIFSRKNTRRYLAKLWNKKMLFSFTKLRIQISVGTVLEANLVHYKEIGYFK